MKEKMLKTLAGWHVRHPYRMIILVLILTLIFGALSEHLQLTMRWSDLLPTNDPRTIEFNKIIDDFVTSTSIIVVVQGEEKQMKKFAEELVPKLLAAVDTSKNRECRKKISVLKKKLASLKSSGDEKKIERIASQMAELQGRINKKLIQRVDYKNEVDFLKQHELLLIKEKDLKNLKEIFSSPNLDDFVFHVNNSMEAEYIQDSESMSTREKEDGAFMFLDGIEGFVRLLNRYADGENISNGDVKELTDKILIGEPYMLSYDKSTLVLNAIPNFTMLDTELMVKGTDVIQKIVDQQLENYPGIRAGLTGFIPVGRDEMYYSQKSLGYTSLIAIIAILILLIISFRMWLAPLFAMINLIIGIVWAIGVAVILVGQLNIMTQMMSVILLGLGIDFSIHLISFFSEKRAAGAPIAEAMEETLCKSGGGVITGGLTTAAAFLTLVVSSSRGMKEMGLVTGFGLLAILVATFLILPIMLVLRERFVDRKLRRTKKSAEILQRDISLKSLGIIADWLGRHYIFSLVSMVIVTIFLVWQASKITFDTNYMNIEAEGLTSIALQDTVLDKFDMSMDYSMVLTDNVEESRQLAEKFRDLGSVAMVEDISLYLPSKEKQQRRRAHIAEVKNAMSRATVARGLSPRAFEKIVRELQRLDMNVKELQDMAYLGGQDKVDNKCQKIVGNPDDPHSRDIILELVEKLKQHPAENRRRLSAMQNIFAPYYKQSILQMCNSSPLTMADLPESILDRYANKTRTQFLTTIYPAGSLWQDSEFLKRFVDDLETVTPRATGMGPVFRALVEIISRDGQIAMVLTLIIIFFLLWLDFKHVGDAFIAMIPLGAGILWMVGLMHLTGQQLTVMNIMGLPLILGIGIDDGVHIIHRWRSEKKTNLRLVFASTGKAILLTSLTTMLAFGSLIFAIWRGFGQLGASLFVGVGACFLTTVIILSGVIGWISNKKQSK